MKKVSKQLALFLAVIVMMSSFSIMPSAVSSTSSAKDILRYYEQCNIDTSAKEDFIKVEHTRKISSVAYVSDLPPEKQKEITDRYNYEKITEGDVYIHGDAYKEYYVNGRSEFIDYFSINRSIKRNDLFFQKGTYKLASNGVATVTFVCEKNAAIPIPITFTAKMAKNGYIQSLTIKQVIGIDFESDRPGVIPFGVEQIIVDTYKFVYREVAVTGIGLPKTHIRLAKDEEYALEPIIYPSNATYQDFYVEVTDTDIANYNYDENGNHYIYGAGLGTTTIKFYTYDGEFMAELEVEVAEDSELEVEEDSLFDKFIDFLRVIFEFFRGFLMF